VGRLEAFGGADFIHKFGREDGDYEAGPVGDGVAVEGAQVGFGIGAGVEHDPGEKDRDGDDAQGMAAEEGVATGFGHGVWMVFVGKGCGYPPTAVAVG